MPDPVVFNDAFLTGIEALDRQHRNLVAMTNEAIATLGADSGAQQIWPLVQELLSYAIYHFKTEEALMQQYAYHEEDRVSAKRHVAMHRDFSARVVGVQESLRRAKPVDPYALTEFLCQWISHHIQGTDRKLADHVRRSRDALIASVPDP